MKIRSFRIGGIRCFRDTGRIELSPSCNILIGLNNVGKSTLLKGILGFQGFPFGDDEVRADSPSSFYEITIEPLGPEWATVNHRPANVSSGPIKFLKAMRGTLPPGTGELTQQIRPAYDVFQSTRPFNAILPFLAKRKAPEFTHDVKSTTQAQITGTYANLYSRIDLVATAGHPRHERFQQALKDIVGLPVTTKSSPQGKQAGIYVDKNSFVPLDRMGDGVTEMVALIVELCLEENKIFVLEEPETNLHPNGLRALLSMVRESAQQNQFIISTHSNIVIRELASEESTKLFRVSRTDDHYLSPSSVELVPRTPNAHSAILRELGYVFADLGLHEGWLFLEESSAETILNEILVPSFAPSLRGRLRTFSAGGATNVEVTIAEFQRLVTFVHLQPVYRGRIWVRTDGDEVGRATVARLRQVFGYLDDITCATFTKPAFELYYPQPFAERAKRVLSIVTKPERRAEKEQLLMDVVEWSRKEGADALNAWQASASEPIELLRTIEHVIVKA
ncbi:MAG TPA: AAA family ATPase [Xanthobacteraceae bacterium]|nr:AAA family ATPase [Xanthobacteraceae bacterium]